MRTSCELLGVPLPYLGTSAKSQACERSSTRPGPAQRPSRLGTLGRRLLAVSSQFPAPVFHPRQLSPSRPLGPGLHRSCVCTSLSGSGATRVPLPLSCGLVVTWCVVVWPHGHICVVVWSGGGVVSWSHGGVVCGLVVMWCVVVWSRGHMVWSCGCGGVGAGERTV